jgi:hypothetical protein
MRPFDAAGKVLDATYSVIPDGTRLALIMESRSGSAAGRPGRNADYNRALTLLLERLGRLDATLVDGFVDSRITQVRGTPQAERRILAGPIRLAHVPDPEALRVQMGTDQAKVAQAPDATKGGNSTKRIRLLLDIPGYAPEQASRLADAIAVPAQELVAPRAIQDRLDAIDDEKLTEADYAAAVSAIDGDLDRAVQTARRVEQSYLRRALFSGPIAPCDLCGREFEVEFLVAAHIKKRAKCSDLERRDVAHVVMSACRFGCDELFERGYISVGDDGQLIIRPDVESSEHAYAYACQHLAGKVFGRPMTGREDYFAWHRSNPFLEERRPS